MVVGRENTRGQGVENALEIGLGVDGSRRIVALPPLGFDLIGGQSEDEDIVPAHMFEDLDIGAIQRTDGQRAIQGELHVAGAGGFHAGRRDLLREICGRDDHFRQADVIVRDEDDLQDVADGRIVVHHAGHVIGELDDEFGLGIAGGSLAGEDLDARRPGPVGMGPHGIVEGDGLEDVHELALVLMDALDLNVEHGCGIEADAHAGHDEIREFLLVAALDGSEALAEVPDPWQRAWPWRATSRHRARPCRLLRSGARPVPD